MTDREMTATILDALRQRHSQGDWVFFPELRIGTGYGKDAETRLDGWAIALYPSHSLLRVTYEIKVSRSDFLGEIRRKPLKRRAGLRMSNEFYFVAPKGLIKADELPPEAGLMEWNPDAQIETLKELRKFRNGLYVTVSAPYRDTLPPTWRFVAALARLADRNRSKS